MKEAAEKLLEDLDRDCGSLVRGIGRQWATAQMKLAKDAGLSPSTDAATTQRELWVLSELRRMDAGERIKALHDAIESGDALTVSAALNAPKSFAVLNDQLAEQTRQRWHEVHLPDQAAEYAALSDAYDTEQRNYDAVVQCVRELGGINDMRSRLEAQQSQQAEQ